jgi:hypothetical protein
MNLTDLLLTLIEMSQKIYAVILRKPYVTIKVQHVPSRDRSGTVTKETIALTIINEGVQEVEVQRVWLLTSFNRPVFSDLLDSKMPIRILARDRTTYFMPMESLKAALNRSAGETIVRAVAFDKTERKHTGRVDRVAQAEFVR